MSDKEKEYKEELIRLYELLIEEGYILEDSDELITANKLLLIDPENKIALEAIEADKVLKEPREITRKKRKEDQENFDKLLEEYTFIEERIKILSWNTIEEIIDWFLNVRDYREQYKEDINIFRKKLGLITEEEYKLEEEKLFEWLETNYKHLNATSDQYNSKVLSSRYGVGSSNMNLGILTNYERNK